MWAVIAGFHTWFERGGPQRGGGIRPDPEDPRAVRFHARGTSPLILLDNVEIPSIQMINPDDIESISVLKDAASSSIYGAKAAFGVLLITTKKGAKSESVNVSYTGNLSFQNISKKMEMGELMPWSIP